MWFTGTVSPGMELASGLQVECECESVKKA
jgi:hypothetical protein